MENYERLQEIGKGTYISRLTTFTFRQLRFGVQNQTQSRWADIGLERIGLWSHVREGEATSGCGGKHS